MPEEEPSLLLTIAPEPVGRFEAAERSVREATVRQGETGWIAYADVVPWDSPHHPNTYATGIALFTSANGADWQFQGTVLNGTPGHWDAGGCATPGAVRWKGRTWLFYSGREREDGGGERHIGAANAAHAAGPFEKRSAPVIGGGGHKDDPRPVVAPDGSRILLYYRHTAPEGYRICLASATDPAGQWTMHGPVLRAEGDVRAVETTEALVIGNRILLAVMEHRTDGTGLRTALYVSSDGTRFARCEPAWLETAVTFSQGHAMGSHLCLHADAGGSVRQLSVTRVLDKAGHYTRLVYDVTAFRLR